MTASTDVAPTARIVPHRVAESRPPATILLVEVEPMLTDSIKFALERDGHRIVAVATRRAGLAAMAVERPGLIMVEFDQSSSDVADFCEKARALTSVPLILITTSISEAEREKALQAGADDLLTKPFSLRDVAQRIDVQLGRDRFAALSREASDEILRAGPVEMDVAHHEVRVRGELTLFPPKEFALLETFIRSRGRLLTRERLIRAVWGVGYFGDGKTLDTHVKRLRKKIEKDPRRPLHLVVVRGLGYRFLDTEHPA